MEKSFIEVQFPVSKISKESYKERKANLGQTLTGLGKWWGRKPLILVRATILGLLLPATDDPTKDRSIFLKLLAMDEEGLYKRKIKSIQTKKIYEMVDKEDQEKYFVIDSKGSIRYKKGINSIDKKLLQKKCFNMLSYDEKLSLCCRPEEIGNVLSKEEWKQVNEYLGTNANSLESLINELGEKRFGHAPIVGDCFSGGGSIPFEAARIGCEVYATDLNPIACLLTWADLNIINKSNEEIENLKEFQKKVYDEVYKKIDEWGIEKNENGDKAVAYLYCTESICPECGYTVPLSPSWIIGKGTNTIAILKENNNKSFDIKIKSNVSNDELKKCKDTITINNGKMICPHCKVETSISALRKDKPDGLNRPYRYNTPNNLRKWDLNDYINREDDIFKERLYCIKYEKKVFNNEGNIETIRYYKAPDTKDIEREKKVIDLLKFNFKSWQEKGYIPSDKIENGWNTNQVIFERGWTYWHQLFNPRQLLVNGLISETLCKIANNKYEYVIGILGLNKCCDWNSKLGVWHSGVGVENSQNTFSNQALNTLYNYGSRGIINLVNSWNFNINNTKFNVKMKEIETIDARNLNNKCDFWITDPPYADAVNYHELSEFFLAWDKKIIRDIFSDWYTDSKRILAIKGDENFNENMVDIYSNLANNMSDNGMQVVMFTHQDAKVWANLALILWASGLQVTSAWNIATETESGGLKEGNYVKGTVILVLRKQHSEETVYLDELYPEIEDEVKYQIDSMKDLDDKEDPNFTDADYLLAAYAASLKVLTSYKSIEDINVQYELSKNNADSPIVDIINDAKKIAFDYLTPNGFDSYIWKTLLAEERFYIKGLDTEKENVYRLSAYQELGRGFGVSEYSNMMENTRANKARLKTASELAMKYSNDGSKFGNSVIRNILIALYKSVKDEDSTKGKAWLKNEVDNYWNERSKIIAILEYISTLENIENMKHWKEDAKYAKILAELIKNDGV